MVVLVIVVLHSYYLLLRHYLHTRPTICYIMMYGFTTAYYIHHTPYDASICSMILYYTKILHIIVDT